MEKYIYNEKNGLCYELQGDYYIPCLELPTEKENELMKQWAEREGVTEKLKANNQMEWVGRMNALRSAVTEAANAEVIFV